MDIKDDTLAVNPHEEVPIDKAQADVEHDANIRSFAWMVTIIVLVIFLILVVIYLKGEDIITIPDVLTGKEKVSIVRESYEFNGYDFRYADGLWYTTIVTDTTEINLPLHFGPRELEKIPMTGYINENFTDPDILYITFNPESEPRNYTILAMGEISLSLVRALGQKLVSACTKNVTVEMADGRIDRGCEKAPTVTCDDEDKAVLYLKQSDETKVILEGNCIIVQGKNENLLRAADRMLLKWYGVME